MCVECEIKADKPQNPYKLYREHGETRMIPRAWAATMHARAHRAVPKLILRTRRLDQEGPDLDAETVYKSEVTRDQLGDMALQVLNRSRSSSTTVSAVLDTTRALSTAVRTRDVVAGPPFRTVLTGAGGAGHVTWHCEIKCVGCIPGTNLGLLPLISPARCRSSWTCGSPLPHSSDLGAAESKAFRSGRWAVCTRSAWACVKCT